MSCALLKIVFFSLIISQIKDIKIPQKNDFINSKSNSFFLDNINYSSKNLPEIFLNNIIFNNETEHNTTIQNDTENNETNKSQSSDEKWWKNERNLAIFYTVFTVVVFFSLISIAFDFNEDKKIIKFYDSTSSEKACNIYKRYKRLKNTKIVGFAFYLFKYIHPILNIFTIYYYNHPRYIRFLIEIIKIQLYFLLSPKPIKGFCSNENKNLVFLILYSFAISTIIYIIIELLTIKFRKIRRNIWKPRLEYLRKYVYYTIKKDVLFNSKWQSIKKRLVTYCRVCGNSILLNKPQDKYEIYMEDKKYNTNSRKLSNLSSLNKEKSSPMQNCEDIPNEIMRESLVDLGLSYGKMSDTKSIFFSNITNSNKNINKSRSRGFSTFSKNVNNFVIDYSVNPFSFSKYGQNRLPLKSVQKIEDIRNKYILNKTEMKYDENIDINEVAKTYKNLEIEHLDNYTFISTHSMINYLRSSNNDSSKIIKNVFINLLFLIILVLINFLLMKVYDSSKSDITIVSGLKQIDPDDCNIYWFIMVLIQLIVVNSLMNLVLSLLISFMIFHFYGKHKKHFFTRIFFNIFVEKYMRYLFKIRLLIYKYDKELQFIE